MPIKDIFVPGDRSPPEEGEQYLIEKDEREYNYRVRMNVLDRLALICHAPYYFAITLKSLQWHNYFGYKLPKEGESK